MSDSTSTWSPDERAARLRMHLTPGVGPGRFRTLLRAFGSARRALESTRGELEALVGPAVSAALRDHRAREEALRRALDALEPLGARVILEGEREYPAALGRLSPPPPALWVRGRVPGRPALGIVGTRRASSRGRQVARDLATSAVADGREVVSGGAYGIDASAHAAALEAGGFTTVVFAGGLDRPYPERHLALFERIARQGAVVSPYPPGTPPVRGGFLARNGVVAALSDALVVVEAGARSGSHSTAEHARRLGVPVLAVPGSPGTDRLLACGAGVAHGKDARTRGADAKPVDEEERRILDALRCLGETDVESVAVRIGLPPAETLVRLMALVLEGHAIRSAGGEFSVVAHRVRGEGRNSFG